MNTEIGAEIPGTAGTGIVGGGSGCISCKATYELLIEEGDQAIPPLGVATFRPATNFTHTAYLSVNRINEKGECVSIAKDSPHQEDCAVIVTSSGGIVDAKSKSNPWVDLNGTNHSSKRVGKNIKEGQVYFLLGCMEDQLGKLGADAATLRKLYAGNTGEQQEVMNMMEDVNKLRKNVDDLMQRPAKSDVV